MAPRDTNTVILAYSGGLDTSCILRWLCEKGYNVIAFVADVGQEEDFDAVEKKALAVGASKVYVEDLKKEFVTDFIFPWVKTNSLYESRYLLGTSLARPCIARKMVEVAQQENAKYISHGATGKGNDQVRFELCCYAFDPELEVIAPWRMQEFLEKFEGRKDLLEYAEKHGIEVSATPKASYSIDENLMHTSYESGCLEDPMTPPPADMFRRSADLETAAKEKPEDISIEYLKGVPVKLTNKTTGQVKTDPLELYVYLNTLAGKHGIGRIDIVENRFVGIKSRGVYETPAGTVLYQTHLDLECLTMDRETMKVRDSLSPKFGELVYNGFWFAPEMKVVMAAIEASQEGVTGTVHCKLFCGNIIVTGREAPVSLYNKDMSSMDVEGGFNAQDSEGFIKVNAIRLRAWGALASLAGKTLDGNGVTHTNGHKKSKKWSIFNK
eukprot:GFYU01004363.1.p1 GENE.GFYU01004363.1~~GFYU01004363.1.p1  ORF type:complete len:439 (-),score=148.86 GFYU01004363.1:121-1437(-)